MEDYLRCVASVDDSVGEVVDWLHERGDFDDTLLMYASDQGFFLGDHGWFDKRFMYEESLRMPLVMSYPRAIAAGQTHEGIVTNVDFAQSILAFAGVAPHERMQGRSFAGDIAAAHPGSAPSAGMYYRYWENDDHNHKAPAHCGYRDARYKLIFFYNDGLGLPGTSGAQYPTDWELYDLKSDPTEVRNVYNDPAYLEIRERLKVDLWRAQAAVGDAPHPLQPVPDGI
ncbi:sulfatase/phosphatase domain-containing protein [Microbacterium sp. ZW T5_56]|uniref:sulfatase/phosphatase domain-containing protein n=1 Tax=Microbacterium sp. ZW T5_56 TaxID=3378081 RepID=UPI00385387D5